MGMGGELMAAPLTEVLASPHIIRPYGHPMRQAEEARRAAIEAELRALHGDDDPREQLYEHASFSVFMSDFYGDNSGDDALMFDPMSGGLAWTRNGDFE